MPCKRCKEEPVFTSPINGNKLCKNCFSNYIERKVKRTIRKYELLDKEDKITINSDNLTLYYILKRLSKNRKQLILSAMSNDSKVREFCKKNEIKIVKKLRSKIAEDSNLDDESEIMLTNQFKNKNNYKKMGPRTKNIIKPLYFCTREELNTFSKIKKLKPLKIKESIITKELNKFEEKHPGAKNSIIKSFLEIKHLIRK